MKNLKLSLAAMSFVAAAGIAGAGTVFINGDAAGTYSNMSINSNGTISLTGNIDYTPNEANPEDPDTCQSPYDDPNTSACETQPPNDSDPGSEAPADCANVATYGERDTSISSFTTFPGGHNSIFQVDLRDDHYLAIRFTAPPAGSAGYLTTETNTRHTGGAVTTAFSQCPGDFSQALPTGECVNFSGRTYWSTRGSQDSYIACVLNPGQTYYLNIMYASGPSMSIDGCPEVICGNDFIWNIIFSP